MCSSAGGGLVFPLEGMVARWWLCMNVCQQEERCSNQKTWSFLLSTWQKLGHIDKGWVLSLKLLLTEVSHPSSHPQPWFDGVSVWPSLQWTGLGNCMRLKCLFSFLNPLSLTWVGVLMCWQKGWGCVQQEWGANNKGRVGPLLLVIALVSLKCSLTHNTSK